MSLRLTALASEPVGRLLPAPAVPRWQLCPLELEGAALRPPMRLLTTWTVDWGCGKTWGGWPRAAEGLSESERPRDGGGEGLAGKIRSG